MKSPVLLKAFALAALLAIALPGASLDSGFKERETLLRAEDLPEAECQAQDCLVVEKGSTYCSIDPFSMTEGQIFASKAELQVSTGIYPLSQREGLAGLTVRIATPHGKQIFRPTSRNIASFHRDDPDTETGIEPLEWIEIRSGLASAGAAIDRLFLRTSRWPHSQFRLGDPQDTLWFFEAQRNLFIRLSAGNALFPNLTRGTIFFAPCLMRNLPDQIFHFAFADGSALDLTVRTVSGVNQIGFYLGRLVEARGRLAGRAVHVSDRNDLAFFGSTRSWSEMAIPTLAVRIQDQGQICGILLDSSRWDTDEAVNGYIAYELTCDERRGEALQLKTVSYPGNFSLP